MIVEKDYENHVKNECPNREYVCPHEHCSEKGTYTHITEVHDEKCKKKLLTCENRECTKTIQRQGLKRHHEICPYTEAPCKYRALGCEAKMKKSELTVHENEEKPHFHMGLLDKMISMQKDIAALKKNKEHAATVAVPKRQQSSSSVSGNDRSL